MWAASATRGSATRTATCGRCSSGLPALHWRRRMDDWNLKGLAWRPHQPEILSSTEEGRAIVLDLPEGEVLQDHQVHVGAWIIVVDGDVRITDHRGQPIDAQPGSLVKLAPQARHALSALA